MTTDARQLPWGAQQLRLSVFAATAGHEGRGADWFNSVAERSADAVTQRPELMIQELTAPFGEVGKLALSIQPQRVDWTLNTADRLPTAAQHVGELSDLTALMDRLVEWVARCELPTSRIGVGLTLVKPVGSREEGYTELDRLIPEVNLDVDSSDFIYQINRCRPSQVVANRTVNRLSNWSVQQVRFGVISPHHTLSMNETGVSYAIRLVLDVNTVPTESPLPANKLSTITKELLEFAREIAENGDIR